MVTVTSDCAVGKLVPWIVTVVAVWDDDVTLAVRAALATMLHVVATHVERVPSELYTYTWSFAVAHGLVRATIWVRVTAVMLSMRHLEPTARVTLFTSKA